MSYTLKLSSVLFLWAMLCATAVLQADDREALDRKVQPVIDEVDKLCRENTVYMIGPEKVKRLAELVRKKKPKLVVECKYSNYHPYFQAIERQLAPDAVVVADNVGIGASGMKDYLDHARSKYQSKPEWFDIDLPWGKRDAMEITIMQPKGDNH